MKRDYSYWEEDKQTHMEKRIQKRKSKIMDRKDLIKKIEEKPKRIETTRDKLIKAFYHMQLQWEEVKRAIIYKLTKKNTHKR